MRVLTVTNMYPTPDRPTYGGFVQSQVESLRAAGITTDVMFVDGATSRVAYARAVSQVTRRVRAGGYDLIHAHYGLTGLVARAQYRVPLVVSFCGDDLLGTPSGRRPGSRTSLSLAVLAACQVLTEVCEGIIVKSRHMLGHLWSARSRRRAHLIPNGIDLEWARPLTRSEGFARLGGLDPSRRYVIFPSCPEIPNKRAALAQRSIERLQRRYSEVELLVVHGKPRELMPFYYAVSDALILTSESEGSPNVVKEALACEVPVVSVDVGDVRERIDGAPSCAVVGSDPDALADALERALDVPRPGGLRARVQSLSADAIAHQIIEVYRQALAGGLR